MVDGAVSMIHTSSPARPQAGDQRGSVGDDPPARSTGAALVHLARPHQWLKSVFVLIGPVYAGRLGDWPAILCTLAAFCLASSACYVINDLRDREADRAHPRKRFRPIARGEVGPGLALAWSGVLMLGAAAAVSGLWIVGGHVQGSPGVTRAWDGTPAAVLVGAVLLLYVANTMLYSLYVKHLVIADVMSLALGFVLRVLGGCAAVLAEPSSWLLNVTLFLAMFLAFGKRLGERSTLGAQAPAARGVQAGYTDAMLRMVVVVTAVACLITYAGYVQAQAPRYTQGFNLLWLTMLPATYGLLRAMTLTESGRYDDPTELAFRDRPFQLAGGLFALITAVLMATMPAQRAAGL